MPYSTRFSLADFPIAEDTAAADTFLVNVGSDMAIDVHVWVLLFQVSGYSRLAADA
jgi:hypothetical protein